MAFKDQSNDSANDPLTVEETAAADGGGEDLSGVLGGGGEVSFVTEQKKPLNTSTLIMGGFLLACGVGTYLMYNRNASANNAPTAEAAAAQTTITQFLSDDAANVNKMKDLLENTQQAVEQFRSSPGKVQVPLDDLQTNPFRVAVLDPGAETVDTDDLTARKRQAEQRAATLKAAQALNLQFIMSGTRKSCMINNKVYREGEQVGEFKVESISADAVVIRKDDARFQLQMKK